MTWFYRLNRGADGSVKSMDVWDHTQDPAVDPPLTTIQNDTSDPGFKIPDDILGVMDTELTPEVPANAATVTSRGAAILRRMARTDIEEYQP